MKEQVIVSWSGGKDSCMALYEIRKNSAYDVAGLLTTITRDYDRISIHGVRRTLLERQAESLGIPLREVYISRAASNHEYESRMEEALLDYRGQGIDTVVFGDLFLQDIKEYRDRLLAGLSMQAIYPIWNKDTSRLIREFIESGFKAVVTCVDPKALDGSFAGRTIDEQFLNDLPASVDACGENGEFHSFVFDGPIFREPVNLIAGETIERDGFCFCDFSPA